MSVISGMEANMTGMAPDTSATARRLRPPTACTGKRFSMRWELPMMPTMGRLILSTSRAKYFSLLGPDSARRIMPSATRGINMCSLQGARHTPAINSARRSQLGVEIGRQDDFQLLEESGAVGRLAAVAGPRAIEAGDHGARDVGPGREHAGALGLAEPGKSLRKHSVEMADQRGAQFTREAIEPLVRLAAGEHADKGRMLGLDGGDALHKSRDESVAIARGAIGIEPLRRELVDALLEALDQRDDDV